MSSRSTYVDQVIEWSNIGAETICDVAMHTWNHVHNSQANMAHEALTILG
jgi:hypothetical protein